MQEKMELEQNNYLEQLERSLLKRSEVEKRQKKREEEKQIDNDYLIQERRDKKQLIQNRIELNSIQSS